jgi:hypothetical protein
LVVAGSAGVNVLLGNGDGTFQPATAYDAGRVYHDVAVAYLEGPSKPADIIGTNEAANTVSILPGNGDGTFGSPTVISLPAGDGSRAVALAVGDLNRGGVDDFVVGTDTGIIPFLSDGKGSLTAGTFQPWVNQDGGVKGSDYNLAIGDVNGDGYPDVVAGGIFHEGGGFCGSCAGADLFLNDGHGQFNAGSYVALGGDYSYLPKVVLANLTGSGRPDLIAYDTSNNSCTAGLITVDLNNGSGGFSGPGSRYGPNCGGDIAAADLNGDGNTDVVTVGQGCFSCNSEDSRGVIDVGGGDGTLTKGGEVATEGFQRLIATNSLLSVPAVVATDGSTLRVIVNPSPPGTSPIGGSIQGGGAQGAHIQACPTSGEPCIVDQDVSDPDFYMVVPNGTYTVTMFPPAGSPSPSQTLPPITVPPSMLNLTATFTAPGGLPEGVSLSSPGRGTQENTVPGLNWGEPSTLRVPGCKEGFGAALISGTNTSTGQSETRATGLIETPSGSGKYLAEFAPLAPIHGGGTIAHGLVCPDTRHLFPDGGSGSGGTRIVLTGSGFTGARGVSFGSTPATSFKVLQDDAIEAVSPAGSGATTISVTASGGGKISIGSFSYFGVTSVDTTSGPAEGGTAVAIRGYGLTDVKDVAFGLLPAASYKLVSATEIDAVAPPGVGTVDVQVVNDAALSEPVTSDAFTYVGGPASLSGIAEGTGPDAPMVFAARLSNAIESPQNAGDITGVGPFLRRAIDCAVHIPFPGLIGGAGVLGLAVGVAIGSPLLAVAGVVLAAAEVWGCLEASFSNDGDVHIDPSGTVVDTHGNPISGATVTVLEGPSLEGPFAAVYALGGTIEPAENPETTGPSGQFDWNALAGIYEVGAAAAGCSAPGKPGQANVFTSPFVLPPPAVGLSLVLECASRTASAPRITGLSLAGGSTAGGNVVDIEGEGLASLTSVHFGGNASVDLQPLSPYAVAAVAPAGSGTVDVTASGAGGTSAVIESDRYTYSAPLVTESSPVIESVAPSSGPVSGGTVVTIKGAHLGGAFSVEFGGTPSLQVTPMSSTEVQAVAPAPAFPVRVDVSVTTPSGTSAPTLADGFIYGSPPPLVATAVTLSSSPNQVETGHPVALTAAVAPGDGGGAVAFYADGSATPIGGCEGQALVLAGGTYQTNCSTAGLGVGSHTIDATYSGDASYAPSSGSTSVSVVEAPSPKPPAGGGGGGGGGHEVLSNRTVRPSTAQIAALLASELTPSGKAAKIAAVRKRGGFALAFRALEAGTAVVNWYQVPLGARLAKKTRAKPVLVAFGRLTFPTAGTATMKIKLTAAGKRLMKRVARLKLTAMGTFTPTSPPPITVMRTFVLKR